jgi:hypothetical protein
MSDLKLSKTFCEIWRRHSGRWPTVETVSRILAESKKVQRCKDLKQPDGKPFRLLAIYWHPKLNLIIKIDQIKNTAVTVISPKMYSESKD